jgi:hypothetical protein
VSFIDVPVAAIAAALPRLHTLHAGNDSRGPEFAAATFFDDLLPRLQSFHFVGWWPEDEGEPRSLVPLPLLQDLLWLRYDRSLFWNPMPLPRGFMGALPKALHGCLPAIVEWLTTVEATRRGSAADGPLAQVRDLWINVQTLEPPELARVLRAAPQLRRLTLETKSQGLRADNDPLWLIAGGPISDPACAGLVHTRLRHLVLRCENDPRPNDVTPDCAFLLQQSHFPRLRRLTFNEREYPVSVTE